MCPLIANVIPYVDEQRNIDWGSSKHRRRRESSIFETISHRSLYGRRNDWVRGATGRVDKTLDGLAFGRHLQMCGSGFLTVFCDGVVKRIT